jgi:hypothetical protein
MVAADGDLIVSGLETLQGFGEKARPASQAMIDVIRNGGTLSASAFGNPRRTATFALLNVAGSDAVRQAYSGMPQGLPEYWVRNFHPGKGKSEPSCDR